MTQATEKKFQRCCKILPGKIETLDDLKALRCPKEATKKAVGVVNPYGKKGSFQYCEEHFKEAI